MENDHAAVAVFATHLEADAAVKKLSIAGFDIKKLSVVGKGYHTEEKVIGFYSVGDRIKFWGIRGAFWGGLWGLFFGGLLLTVPAIGPVVVLGYLAATAIAALENALLVGGISALGAALYGLGLPENSVIQYEAAVKADRFLVMAHGAATEIDRAKAILATTGPAQLDVHGGIGVTAGGGDPRVAAGA
jgi:hypothetical protein